MHTHIYSWGWESDPNCIEQADSYYLMAWIMGVYSIGKPHSNSLWHPVGYKLGYAQVCSDFGKLVQ
jgi:hypothetical protein